MADNKAENGCTRCAELAAQVAALEAQVNALEAKLAKSQKHSGNSSKPPSSDVVKPPPRKKGSRRHIARAVAAWLARRLTAAALRDLAGGFGLGRPESVSNLTRRIDSQLAKNPRLAHDLSAIESRILRKTKNKDPNGTRIVPAGTVVVEPGVDVPFAAGEGEAVWRVAVRIEFPERIEIDVAGDAGRRAIVMGHVADHILVIGQRPVRMCL